MNPFEAIKAKLQKVTDNREQLKNDIARLKSDVEDLSDQMKDAAVNNDIDRYTRLKEQKAMKENMAEIKEVQLSQVKDISSDEIFDAWREYRPIYEKEFDKAEAALEEARQKYMDAFRKLVIVQNNGLKEQAKFGALMGWVPGDNRIISPGLTEHFKLIDRLPMKIFQYGDILKDPMLNYRGTAKNPDVAMYFTRHPDSKVDVVMRVLTPVKEEEI